MVKLGSTDKDKCQGNDGTREDDLQWSSLNVQSPELALAPPECSKAHLAPPWHCVHSECPEPLLYGNETVLCPYPFGVLLSAMNYVGTDQLNLNLNCLIQTVRTFVSSKHIVTPSQVTDPEFNHLKPQPSELQTPGLT